MANIASWRAAFVGAVFALVWMAGGTAKAGGLCTADGQILLPSGTCLAGYYGYAVSNCLAVGNNALVVQVPSGHLTCVAGPSCPAGYQQGLPPPQNSTPGFPGTPPGSTGYQVSTNMCQAVCTPTFSNNDWPCSCPYGQKLDKSGYCAPACGGGGTWQHTPGYNSKQITASYVVSDPGVCTCPSGQEYVGTVQKCMAPCPQGQIRDSSGMCYSTSGGGPPANLCKDGQLVGSCVCPSGGVVKSGRCYLCSIKSPSSECQSAAQSSGEGDEVHPIGPISPQPCSQGAHWNGFKCIVNSSAPPSCASGTHWNGKACAADEPAAHNCPAGTLWNGIRCSPMTLRPLHVCGRDQHWDGRACVANGCSVREHWDGQRCVAN